MRPLWSLHDLLADRQPDAGTDGRRRGVEPLEDHEDPVEVAGLDADAVVLDGEVPVLPLAPGRDPDAGRPPAPVREGVLDEVPEQLRELGGVGVNRREPLGRDLGPGLGDLLPQGLEGLGEGRCGVGEREAPAAAADAGVGEEPLDQLLHPAGVLGGDPDVGVGGRVELSAVVRSQPLHEGGDHPERFLQVVAGDVGELLEVPVRPEEVLGDPAQLGGALRDDLLEVVPVLLQLPHRLFAERVDRNRRPAHHESPGGVAHGGPAHDHRQERTVLADQVEEDIGDKAPLLEFRELRAESFEAFRCEQPREVPADDFLQ